ncbi:hypothetical protein KR032_002068 [Drosophila birchii]|nr:hypothetical protein KR032_002068 [Drosophila birchii]
MPFNFFTLHTPCDMDIPFAQITGMPEHCKWLYNNRFQSIRYYKAYQLLRTEAFFFGQYHQRLRRYETDPHVFTYD